MKKLVLFIPAALMAGMLSAQQNPCAAITNIQLDSSGVGGPYTVRMSVKNDISANHPKGIQVIVSDLNNPVSSTCYLPAQASTLIQTPAFQIPRGNIRVRIVRYTSSSGSCHGGTCSPDLLWEPNSNIPLPVNFKSFNANRSKSNVNLTWETSSESNNRGFAIQRKTNGNDFSTIAFVDTKASGGNSDKDIAYTFHDMNPVKGLSQYRIQQIDFDGKSKYTEIKTVRGEEQSSKTIVYPNPSNNGVVNVVFEDNRSVRDMQLLDINGRTVNQWRNHATNQVRIENLAPGFYNLRIVDQNTNEQSMEKIVIGKY